MNPYPPAAEVADNQLSERIKDLTTETRGGFNKIDARIDSMATKDLVRAVEARLDLRVDHTESRVDSGLKDVQLRMDTSFASIAEREAARDAAAIERDRQRDAKFARRMTWTISIVGVGFTVFQFIFNQFS